MAWLKLLGCEGEALAEANTASQLNRHSKVCRDLKAILELFNIYPKNNQYYASLWLVFYV
ncbi:hypothetical protein NUITMVS1_36210 [Shewanella xiamenensis]|nr:hypothetical protein NUITMVS1_36210 [Shewanella xiamenensis]BDQ67587.1 hypothetical protein NUITMVS2_33990 [Shewanella xiamenensis]GLD78535.1 hypothetical protein NUITMVS3_29670 [Shewanella xiamenensis]